MKGYGKRQISTDEGVLEWDRPIKDYLPEFKLYDSIVTYNATLRDLACHRTGLPRYDILLFQPSLTRKEIVERLQYLKPTKGFRSSWQYQNHMYSTLGYLIEKVTNMSWEDFVIQMVIFLRYLFL